MSYQLKRGTRWEHKVRDEVSWQRDLAYFSALFESKHGRRPIWTQANGITAGGRWLFGAVRVEKRNGQTGQVIDRTIGQLITGFAFDLDWELSGDRRADRARFRPQVLRRLGYLVGMGLIEGWEDRVDARGESMGIRIYVPAGVAQSVEASLRAYRPMRRPAPPPSPLQQSRRAPETAPRGGSGQLYPPYGSASVKGCPSSLKRVLWDERPRARPREGPGSVDAIERACPPQLRPALRPLRTALRESERPKLVLRDSALAGTSIVVLILAWWEYVTGGRAPRLSLAARAQLERSAAQYDRLNRPGAALLLLVEALENFEDDERHDFETIRSLGYYVHTLKQKARLTRRAQRRAGKPRPWRSRKPQASSW
jgi:hypothetical protein